MTLIKDYEAYVTTSQNYQTSMNNLTEIKIDIQSKD